MTDSRFIKSIRLRNLLSFGPDSEEFELMPLNVLIGPNASGKSNFIEAIDVFRATTWDINAPMINGGGLREWIWKGKSESQSVEIEAQIIIPQMFFQELSLHYIISFRNFLEKLYIEKEIIEDSLNNDVFFYRYLNNKSELKMRVVDKTPFSNKRMIQELKPPDFTPLKSILSQREDPVLYPELTSLKKYFSGLKIYRNLYVGLNAFIRLPQRTDLQTEFISENLNNFALIVNDLKDRRETKDVIIEKLRLFYKEVENIKTEIKGGTVQLFFNEKGLKDPIPATRLSDGTLRYLCLLAILLHPEPPPLICIEEPEIGLHPDIMPTIAELLIDASQRTQLIVTTHSDVLVSALSETPESVVVCEHDESGTHMRWLDKEKLKSWLKKYSLGELWRMGEIGGTRW